MHINEALSSWLTLTCHHCQVTVMQYFALINEFGESESYASVQQIISQPIPLHDLQKSPYCLP